MTRVIGVDFETSGAGPRLVVEAPYVPSPRCKPWPGRPGLYIMEADFSGLELQMMELVRREEARRRPLQVYRPVLPPFWPIRPARDLKRPGAFPARPPR